MSFSWLNSGVVMSRYNSEPPACCSASSSSSAEASAELKLYQAFIFSVPIFFTFILLFLFYLFYLRRRRVDWASLRMRTSLQDSNDTLRQVELGLKKELREMLPIIVYKESFSVRDTQCAVCLGDYQAEDRLQQIPACGHTFHMECIDHWLANHTTCPLCRLSLLAAAKVPGESTSTQVETIQGSFVAGDDGETSVQPRPQTCGESQVAELSELRTDFRTLQNNTEQEETKFGTADEGTECRDSRNDTAEQEHQNDGGSSEA